MSDAPTTLAYERTNPWYQLGTPVEGAMTAKEALQRGGLDWEVELRPAGFVTDEGKFVPVPAKQAVVRKDNDQGFGFVGKNYRTWQNADAFRFADGLVDGGLLFDSVGSYRNGSRIFLTAKLPETVQILGEDPYDLYLFITTAHDGTQAITASVTPMRLRCTNMMQLALRNAVTRWRVRHTSTADGRLAEAREALALTFKAEEALEREMEWLASESAAEVDLRAACAKVLPKTPKVGEKVDEIVRLFHESPSLDGYRGTRYAALNAFTEWLDWGREVRSDAARFQVSFDGYGARQRDRLYALVTSGM